MRWLKWHRYRPSAERLDEAHRLLEEAKRSEARTSRLARRMDRAITQNHFARDFEDAMPAREA